MNTSADWMRQASVSARRWLVNVQAGKYADPWATKIGQALLALEREAKAAAPPQPPPPPTDAIPSVFHGRGMLATWNTESVFRELAPYLDWIALLGRLPDTTRALADEIRQAGPHVLLWEDENSNMGWSKVDEVKALGYLGQGESAWQRADKVRLGAELDAHGVPKALVDNLDPASGQWPSGWLCVPECYEAANPNATVKNMAGEAKQRGATAILPLYQLYVEGAQQPVDLDRYLAEAKTVPETAHGHWCGYSLLTEAGRPHDLDVLKALGRVR